MILKDSVITMIVFVISAPAFTRINLQENELLRKYIEKCWFDKIPNAKKNSFSSFSEKCEIGCVIIHKEHFKIGVRIEYQMIF